MKQFEIDKKYKFDMAMKQEFFDAHDCNEEVFYDLEQFDYEITVSYIEGDTVHYKGDYVLYQTDIKFFFLVVDVPAQKENVVSNKSESEIVKAWFEKLKWLDDNTPIAAFEGFVTNEVDIQNNASDCIDFVINSYEAYQNKAKQKEKQSLLDKKATLEL